MQKYVRSVVALAALFLLTMTACGSVDGKTTVNDDNAVTEQGGNQALTVLVTEKDATINLLTDIARAKYPNMIIEFINKEYYGLEDETAFMNKVAGEIMAGGGSDIISPQLFKNLENAMKNGIFEDLSPYLEKDGDYNKGDYSDAIIAASTFDGQQLLMPINIQIPLYITTAAFEQQYDFDGKSLYEIVDLHAQNGIEGNPYEHYYEPLFINDFSNKTTGLGEPEFLNFVKQRRNLSAQIKTSNDILVPFEKNPLIYVPGMPNLDTYITMLTHTNELPVIIPALDEQGKLTGQLSGLGINANSQNKQAAYDFLKLAFTMPTDIEQTLKKSAEKHADYVSLISPNAYSFFANKAMQNKLFNEYFEMYKTGTIYSLNNSLVDVTKAQQSDIAGQYFSFYDKLDRCQYSSAYRYSKELSDYIYKKVALSDTELQNLVDRECDKAKVSISE